MGTANCPASLKAASCDTELNVVQEGVPDVIPLEQCYPGWQQSQELPGKLREAEVQG